MADIYFIYLNKSAYGPYTTEQIRAMVATGKMQATTLVFQKGGSQQWLPALNYPQLMKPASKNAQAFAANPAGSSVPLIAGDIEKTIWEGRPSMWKLFSIIIKYSFALASIIFVPLIIRQFLHFPIQSLYVLYWIGGWIIAFCLALLWHFVSIKTKKWNLSTERITQYEGVFSRHIDNLELYRIKDITVYKPFLLRIVRHGYIHLWTSDITHPNYEIGPIKNPQDICQIIRKYTERQRQRRAVREIDFGHGV